MTIEERIDLFKEEILKQDSSTIIDRYYYSGDCAVLLKEQEAELRRAVSNKFDISMRDVILVGSARLGFTLTPKPGRPPLSQFDNSDIDVAIISQNQFVKYWEESFRYWSDHGNWGKEKDYRKYLFRGWLRPDMLPTGEGFSLSNEWFDFFRELQASGKYGGYRINAGIYFDEKFWEIYAATSIDTCKKYIEDGI